MKAQHKKITCNRCKEHRRTEYFYKCDRKLETPLCIRCKNEVREHGRDLKELIELFKSSRYSFLLRGWINV